MYRCNPWRLSAKSLVKISVRDSEVVGIAVLSVCDHATPIRGYTATLATRMGVFVLSGVVRIADHPINRTLSMHVDHFLLLRGTGFKVIPLSSGLTKRLIAVLLIAPSLWNVALSKLPSAATVVALDPGVTAGVGARRPLRRFACQAHTCFGHHRGRTQSAPRRFECDRRGELLSQQWRRRYRFVGRETGQS